MTIEQLIAITASIGACLSAIATFLTVRQIANQREATYHPELDFSRTFFEAIPDQLRGGPLPSKWINKQSDSEAASYLYDLSIPMWNVGLGTAKAVVISWSFPIELTIERVNQSAQRTLTPAYFCCDESGVHIKSESLGNGISMLKNQQRATIDFVLPASVQKEPIEVTLPHAYIQLCSAVLYLGSKDKNTERSFEVPALTAHIEYIDIGNRSYRTDFEFQLHMTAIVGTGESFSGYIECKKNP